LSCFLADKVTGTEEEKAEAAKHFAEINHAYETLIDAKKREIYDQYGEEGLRQQQQQVSSGTWTWQCWMVQQEAAVHPLKNLRTLAGVSNPHGQRTACAPFRGAQVGPE